VGHPVRSRIGISGGRGLVLAAALAVSATAGSCRSGDRERQAVEAWLTCIDCLDAERESVQALGSSAVPYLSQAVYGPPPLRIANAEQLARRAWQRIEAPTIPESTFVRKVKGDFVALYQDRAAISLGDIRTGGAIAGLRAVLKHDSVTADTSAAGGRYFRPDVQHRIRTELALAEAQPFPGVVTPDRNRFHDTVVVRADAAGGLAGRTAQIVGAPFGRRVTVARWGDDSLAIIAAAPAGRYPLRLNVTAAGDSSWAVPLAIQLFRYDVHGPTSAPEMTEAGFPRIHFPVLGVHGTADSIDYFRFSPTDTVAIAAELDWVLPGELDLGWFECPSPGEIPREIGTSPTLARPEVSQVLIPAGRCVLLGVVSQVPGRRVFGRLEITEVTVDSVAARLQVM